MAMKPMRTMRSRGMHRGSGAARGLGDYVGQPGQFDNKPTVDELIGVPATQEIRRGPGTPNVPNTKIAGRNVEDRRNAPLYRNIPVPAHQFVITPRLISTTPLQLDIGVFSRADIAIWNVSTVTIWVGTSNSVAANAGCPLGPSAANAYNGAAVSADVAENVRFWGVASAAGSNLVVVMESVK